MDIVIRPATLDDAAGVGQHHHEISLETDIDVPMRPGDMPMDRESLERYIEHFTEPDNSTAIVAEVDGKIVGLLLAQGGKPRIFQHVLEIGIAVNREYRGQGIGTRLMQAIIEWAQASEVIKRVQLDVYTRNQGAIKMYERLGFANEGCRRKALRHDDEYVDLYPMSILV